MTLPPPSASAPPAPSTLVPPDPWLVRLTAAMNAEPAKALWTAYQRLVGAQLVAWALGARLRVHGLEHLRAVSRDRPLLLTANHRSYFDLFVVSSVLLRQLPGPWRLFFPVRGRYCYRSVAGALLNGAGAGWSMYPPFFREPGTHDFDRRMLERLVALLRQGRGHVVGFHPEGTRNRDADPHTLLRPHPGVGEIILAARPQIVPVFVAGLGNNARALIRATYRGGGPVRVHFGPALPDDAFRGLPPRARSYLVVANVVMQQVARLAEEDRALYGASADPA